MGYQEHTARLEKHKSDAALERSVLKLFYLDPEKLQVRSAICIIYHVYVHARLCACMRACVRQGVLIMLLGHHKMSRW